MHCSPSTQCLMRLPWGGLLGGQEQEAEAEPEHQFLPVESALAHARSGLRTGRPGALSDIKYMNS